MISTLCLSEDQLGAILESKLPRADEAAAWLHIADCAECAGVFNELAERRADRTSFGNYKLIALLGRGGMGEVYLARGPSGRPVVIKRILGTLLDNPDILRGFLDETRIAARLRHPNIVRIDELGEVDGEWFVRMEHVEGASLFEVLKRAAEAKTLLPLEATLSLGASIARALDYAHHAVDAEGRPLGLVHRDVTPHNMLLSRSGVVKLIDFGVARAEQSLLRTLPGMIKGKLAYMSIEQAQGKVVDGRTDIFALGVCLWESLTGRRLFRAETEVQTMQRVFACQVAPPSMYRAEIPAEVDALVLKAVARAPADRFARASDLAEAIETVIERGSMHGGAGAIASLMRSLFTQPPLVDDEVSRDEELTFTPALKTKTRAGRPSSLAQAREKHAKKVAEQSDPGFSLEGPPPSLLPEDEHALIGRAAELADLHQFLGNGARLITMLGPGGVGKSRLAREIARQQGSQFRGRVWFADLASTQSFETACVEIADSMGAAMPSAGTPVEAIGGLLASRRECLLIIDHAETLPVPLSHALGEWLRVARGASFLVCSQVALGAPTEQLYEVNPLPFENEGEVESDAMQLFLERARSQNPHFDLGRLARSTVQKLVRKLEGIPLAIELAAAQMADASLETLENVAADASRAYTPMDEAFETTWARLTVEERSALAQCTAFSAGFTADAAIEVLRWPGIRTVPHAERVLKVLHRLRATSLLRVGFSAKSRQPRYGMYESIRARVSQRLLKEEAEARERHAVYFLTLGELLGPAAEKGAKVLDLLTVERENLMRAWEWWFAQNGDGPKNALRVLLVLDAVFVVRGPYGAHLSMLDSVLNALKRPADRAPALEARAKVLLARGKLQEAELDLEALLDAPVDAGSEGRAFAYLGSVRKQAGALTTAKELYERALKLLAQANDTRMRGRVLANLGAIAQEEGNPKAESLYATALALHREAEDRRFEGVTLTNLAVLQQAGGDWAAAEHSCTQAIAVHKEVGNRRSEGIAVTNLADLERDRGTNDLAVVLYRRAVKIHREVGNRRFEGICLLNQALLMLESSELEKGRELLEEALDLFEAVGDKRHGALTLAARGALRAYLKEAGADEDFTIARKRLVDSDVGFIAALEVYRAQLQLAQADRLSVAGHEGDASAWREAAGAQIDSAVAPGELGSLAERFEHVRMALRVLKAWLVGVHATANTARDLPRVR